MFNPTIVVRRTTKFNHCLNRCLIRSILFINRAPLPFGDSRLLTYARSYRFSKLNSSNTPMSTNQRKGALIWVMEFSRTALPGSTIPTCNQPKQGYSSVQSTQHTPQRMIDYEIATERPLTTNQPRVFIRAINPTYAPPDDRLQNRD